MALSPKNSAGQRFRWCWASALAATLIVASGNNPAAIPGSFVGMDKLAHFAVFGLLATLVLRTEAVWRRSGRGWLALIAVSVFGATDEWHQSFTPGRSVEFADWLADSTGAALAVMLYLRWSWYRGLLERPLFRRNRTPGPAQGALAPTDSIAAGRN